MQLYKQPQFNMMSDLSVDENDEKKSKNSCEIVVGSIDISELIASIKRINFCTKIFENKLVMEISNSIG